MIDYNHKINKLATFLLRFIIIFMTSMIEHTIIIQKNYFWKKRENIFVKKYVISFANMFHAFCMSLPIRKIYTILKIILTLCHSLYCVVFLQLQPTTWHDHWSWLLWSRIISSACLYILISLFGCCTAHHDHDFDHHEIFFENPKSINYLTQNIIINIYSFFYHHTHSHSNNLINLTDQL